MSKEVFAPTLTHAHESEGVEFWFARDLQGLLGYTEWRKFQGVIEKAKESCRKSGHNIPDHFVDAAKKVKIGSEAEREIADIILTRSPASSSRP